MKKCAAFLLCIVSAFSTGTDRDNSRPSASLRDIKILNDRAPDCSSLKSIVGTVTKDCKTDDARVIAIYNFCRYIYYHHAYPNEPHGISALKLINVYGWGLCGGLHTVMAALWEAAGYKWRYRGWSSPGHTTVEVFYGGRWHYLDTFLKFYVWMPDPKSPGGRTIAGQEDIKANPSLVTDGFWMDRDRKVCYHSDDRFDFINGKINWTAPAFMVCGDTLSGVLSGIRSSHRSGSPRGWGGIRFDDPAYSTAVDLLPGYSLTLNWQKTDQAFYFRGHKKPPHHTCGDKDYRNSPSIGPMLEPYRGLDPSRSWSNGILLFKPDFKTGDFLTSFYKSENVAYKNGALYPRDSSRPGILVIRMSSPYVVVTASCRINSGDAATYVSTDLKKFTSVSRDQLGRLVSGKYEYYLRVSFKKSIKAIEVKSTLQHNQEALPYLAPGRNRITVTAANPNLPASSRLVVTYTYSLGSRTKTPAQVFKSKAEIARAHYAKWSDKIITVQKVINKLPATFEIVIPTPENRMPVYPRMLFLRRELLLPGQKPLPVPTPPVTPKTGPGQRLVSLPNPWTIGTKSPSAE